MRCPYSTRTLVTSALGYSVLLNYHTVLTASLARIFLLLTHSMGLGSFEGLNQ